MREPPEVRIAAGTNGSANCGPRFWASTTESQALEEADARQLTTPAATIKIILAAVNRRGRSWASLLDGTVLVASSRQPFLDAARVLVDKGYDPDCWLEGWRAGATVFALRARLGIAAGLTVDETRTGLATWKAFSSSAVASSIRHSEQAATTLAAAPSALQQPPLEKPPEITPSIADSGVAGPTAPLTTDRLLRPDKVD
jgi:hypothetical protein